jgi:outer membrane lipoprotein-sorting protein
MRSLLLCFLIFLLATILSWHNGQTSLANPLVSQAPIKSEGASATVINAVRQDLSNRTRIAANKFKVIEASQKTWSDGCLGLAGPDEICTQMLVEGWRIVMSDGDRNWIYRTDAQGNTIRLETQK